MKNFKELFEMSLQCPPKKIVVAGAQDKEALAAIYAAHKMGLGKAILIGDMYKVSILAQELGMDLSEFENYHEEDIGAAAKRAVAMANSGKADMVVKGLVNSSVLLRAVLDKNTGLRTGRVLSQVTVFEVPGEEKVMLMTDAGLNIAPTFDQKVDMVKNALCVAKALKIEKPKVAVIAGAELVNHNMPSSIDGALLSKMAERGQIKDCIIDGPLSLDLAVSPYAAKAKGVLSPVAGQADILVLPNIDAGNIFYKSMSFLAKVQIASIIAGAKVPITLPSRADSHEAKLASIALGILAASKPIKMTTQPVVEYLTRA